jgi:hypothetical protein
MTFQLDTSGVVPFDGGTLGVISWNGLGQLPNGPFVQGYMEAMFVSISPVTYRHRYRPGANGVCVSCGKIQHRPRTASLGYSDLAPETLERIIQTTTAWQAKSCDRSDRTQRERGAAMWKACSGAGLTVYLGDDRKVRFQ